MTPEYYNALDKMFGQLQSLAYFVMTIQTILALFLVAAPLLLWWEIHRWNNRQDKKLIMKQVREQMRGVTARQEQWPKYPTP